MTSVKPATDLPTHVKEIENVWIPMSDGTRLAARIWMPEDADTNPVPAILEYIPYRKRDFTAVRDSMAHPYFAGHGYAGVRVDLRGSGDSDGVLEDEYLEQEMQDGLEVLRWLAEQPWCDGSVGMIGISWGGFNGLQIAAYEPAELKAVITLCSTDDRYADDVHYMGGCLLGDNLSWASTMFAYNSLPPDPEIVGERWRDMWMERLDGSGLWLEKWMHHQRRDDYWKFGSVCENFSNIKCPVMAASGWADGYTNSVFRLMEHLDVPRQALIGPWSHKYPHIGKPGPAIGFLQEALRWWDYWLKGVDTGIMDEPMMRAWMQSSVPPTTSYEHRPGRWVGEPSWPSPNIEEVTYPFGHCSIFPPDQNPGNYELTIQSPLTIGLFAGKWCSYAAGPDLAHDQREEDGGALVFDSGPIEETIEIFGAPTVDLELSADQPVAFLAVRLCDVLPDDKANRITYGVLNLTHRNSHEHPEPLEPGKKYNVRIQLNDIAQVFPKGNKLRVSISTSYWPLIWPPPRPTRLTIYTGNSGLTLPIRRSSDNDGEQIHFDPPQTAPKLAKTMIQPAENNWRVIRDLATDKSTLEVIKDEGVYRLDDINLEITSNTREWYSSVADDFQSARGETYVERGLKRGDWEIRTIGRTVLHSDSKNFYIHADLDAYEKEFRVFSRTWNIEIPRDHV